MNFGMNWVSQKTKRSINAISFLLLCISQPAFAADSLGDVAARVTGSFTDLTKLISGGAYVAGFAIAMVGIFKLKAHKDNPTQIPISTGLALIFVGAALVFLPGLLGVGLTTLFGDEASGGLGGPSGVSIITL